MITIKRAKKESRARDKKRKRFILSIGQKHYHLSRAERAKLLQPDQARVIRAALYWYRVYCFQVDTKPGKSYYKLRATLEELATDRLFDAVEKMLGQK